MPLFCIKIYFIFLNKSIVFCGTEPFPSIATTIGGKFFGSAKSSILFSTSRVISFSFPADILFFVSGSIIISEANASKSTYSLASKILSALVMSPAPINNALPSITDFITLLIDCPLHCPKTALLA